MVEIGEVVVKGETTGGLPIIAGFVFTSRMAGLVFVSTLIPTAAWSGGRFEDGT